MGKSHNEKEIKGRIQWQEKGDFGDKGYISMNVVGRSKKKTVEWQ